MVSCRCTKQSCRRCAGDNLLLLLTAVAIVCGIALGISLRYVELSLDAIIWIKIWGELFMRMLKMLILPMVMACLVVGLSNLEGKASGKLGAASLIWVFSTQLLGIALGLIMAVAIHPGSLLGGEIPEAKEETSYTDVFGDFLRNLIPDNMVQSCFQSVYATRENVSKSVLSPDGNGTVDVFKEVIKLNSRNGMNTLGVVVISLFIGFGIQAGGERAKPLADFFDALNVVIFKIVGFVLWYSPIGILSLIAGALVEVDNLGSTLQAMLMYIITVLAGLATYQLIILPLLYLAFVRKNPFKFLWTTLEAMLAGAAASSSAVGFPFLIKASEDKWNIDSKVANFCLPIFTQINRDGSVLFMSVCIVFVAQTYGISIPVAHYFLICVLYTMLSVTVVAVPSSSIVVIIMIAGVINVPVTNRLGLIMALEWLLDRLRTMTNLESNAVGVSIIDHILKPRTRSMDNHLRLEIKAPKAIDELDEDDPMLKSVL